jgi:hypothetical protein
MSFFGALSPFLIALCVAGGASADVITPSQALEHVGEEVTVEGVLEQVSEIDSGTIFLNYGGRFPDHIFYGVIFGDYADSFPDLRGLEGSVVSLTGTIYLYRGKPQIILLDPSQIQPK